MTHWRNAHTIAVVIVKLSWARDSSYQHLRTTMLKPKLSHCRQNGISRRLPWAASSEKHRHNQKVRINQLFLDKTDVSHEQHVPRIKSSHDSFPWTSNTNTNTLPKEKKTSLITHTWKRDVEIMPISEPTTCTDPTSPDGPWICIFNTKFASPPDLSTAHGTDPRTCTT